MKKLHIFIETSISQEKKNAGFFTNEYHFIDDYLHHVFPNIKNEDYDITDVGGKDKLNMYDNAMKQNTAKGEVNLVIFDCDDPTTNGGIKKRTEEIVNLKPTLGVEFKLFLFPNNSNDGAFEDLLLQIINPEHQGLLDCFRNYEMCIGGQDPEGIKYQTPNKKAEIYSYITSFKHSRKQRERIKGGDWNFTNKKYWNLDAEYLSPLKEFLLNNLEE